MNRLGREVVAVGIDRPLGKSEGLEQQLLKRVLKGFGAVFSGQALNTFGNVILVPTFLSHWSTTTYGEWMALSAVIAYLNATDLGMNAAAGNRMLAAYATADWATYRTVQGSAIAFYTMLAAMVTIASGAFCGFFPVAGWLGIRSIPSGTAAVVAWMLACRTVWQMTASQFANVYRTTGNLAATQWMNNGQAFVSVAVTIIVVELGGNVLGVAVCSVAVVVAGGAVALLSIRRWRKDLMPRPNHIDTRELLRLVRPSLWFGLMTLAIAMSVQGPVIIVSAVLGGTAVALLVTTRTLTFLLRQALGMMTAVLWPELTRLDAIGKGSALRFAHRVLLVVSVVTSSAFASALWWEGSDVLQIWTNGKIQADTFLLRAFLIALVLQGPWVASAAFTTATNRHKNLSYSWVASSVVALIVCALLLRRFGIAAVPIGTIIGEGIACYHFVIEDTCRAVGEDYRALALRLWPSVLVVFFTSLFIGRLGHQVAIGPTALRWVEVGALTSLAAVVVGWLFALGPDDRCRILRHLGSRSTLLDRYTQRYQSGY